MYQEKNDVSHFEITSRSNTGTLSTKKPQRPRLVSNNEIYQNEKENDRRRINERIEGKKDWKNKIKDQEIDLYPIEEDQLGTIIEGILKWG